VQSKSTFLHIKFIIIPALVAGMFVSCGNNLDEVKQITGDQNAPEEVTEGVTMYFTDMGKSKLKMEAPKVLRYAGEEHMTMECPIGMVVTFYDSLEQIESILAAKYGKLETESQYLHVEDSVVFRNYKHDTLNANHLHIYFGLDSLTSTDSVTISSELGLAKGNHLIANSNFTRFKLENVHDSHVNYEDQETQTDSTNLDNKEGDGL